MSIHRELRWEFEDYPTSEDLNKEYAKWRRVKRAKEAAKKLKKKREKRQKKSVYKKKQRLEELTGSKADKLAGGLFPTEETERHLDTHLHFARQGINLIHAPLLSLDELYPQ